MNKVITIHLNGVAYQLEEQGFDALRAYLDTAGRRLEGNPDRDEILADIEQAIGDKFRSLLGPSKTVIVTKEVSDIIAAMGPVEDATGTQDAKPGAGPAGAHDAPRAAAPGAGLPPKRLFKIREGAKIAGVCNGIAAYLGIDVTIVRVIMFTLIIAWGSGIILYLVLMFVLPEAESPDDVAAAHGSHSATAQEFIRRAREGYYEGMKTFGDRRAHREWRRKFKSDMRGWRRNFRREMNQSTRSWRDGWHSWGPPGPDSGTWFTHSFFGLILSLLSLFCFVAIISLIVNGSILGITFPGIPVWLAIILVIAVIKIVKWPFRLMRGSYYGYHHCGPFGFLFSALMWIGAIYFFIWVMGGHVGGLHEVAQHLPPKLHHAAQSLKDWWDQQ
jgi:phage shock protein PspC (stress-responsive transcriptional regulator)